MALKLLLLVAGGADAAGEKVLKVRSLFWRHEHRSQEERGTF